MNKTRAFLYLLGLCGLYACGGGGGSSASTSTAVVGVQTPAQVSVVTAQ